MGLTNAKISRDLIFVKSGYSLVGLATWLVPYMAERNKEKDAAEINGMMEDPKKPLHLGRPLFYPQLKSYIFSHATARVLGSRERCVGTRKGVAKWGFFF